MHAHLRIWRSWRSEFGKLRKVPNDLLDETVTANAAYTDAELSKIAQSGFNAIWVHGILGNMVPTKVFPELGKNWRIHTDKMLRLTGRAAKFGLKVLVYMQPPRALHIDDPFWKSHADIIGTKTPVLSDDNHPIVQLSLCTSTRQVQDFLQEGARNLVTKIPGLGGIILITASEYPAHCYTRYDDVKKNGFLDCPRCMQRTACDVAGEVIQLIRDGVRSVSKETRIIAWNWSWMLFEKDPSATIIKNLPKDVLLLCDFERGDHKTILGKVRKLDEYSLAFVGPSRRFKDSCAVARKNGIRVMAKFQLGTTHELATVPNLPLIANLYAKAEKYIDMGIEGFMGCWNFGNMISANTAAFNTFLTGRKLGPQAKALADFASTYFPGCNRSEVVRAWETFGAAMNNYPFCIPFLYGSCCNYTLQYPMAPRQIGKISAGRAWLPDKRGDNLDRSLGAYTLGEIIRGLGLLAKQWEPGLALLAHGLQACPGENARKELDNARMIYHIYRSAWNTYRAYKLRKQWSAKKMAAYSRIARNELANLDEVIPVLERDHEKRFGFHPEAHAFLFDIQGVRKKLGALKKNAPG